MTNLREAAQQALEALEADNSKLWPSEKRTAAITALKAALAEPCSHGECFGGECIYTPQSQRPAEPVQERNFCQRCGKRTNDIHTCTPPQEEPVAGRAFLERILTAMEGVIDVADRKTDEFDALRSCVIDLTMMLHTAPPQREPVQEPVAWMFVDDTGMRFVSVDRPHKHCQPLYTAPPQRPAEATTIAEWWADRKRKPLTKEKIRELLDIETEALPSYRSAVEELPERLARAVERAHGIGVDK